MLLCTKNNIVNIIVFPVQFKVDSMKKFSLTPVVKLQSELTELLTDGRID